MFVNRFALLLGPLGLILAWSAPWACQEYTLPDGGLTTTPPVSDGSGHGGAFAQDASVPVVLPLADAGSGLLAGPDGGITIGPAANFVSDFVYMSNAAEDSISRVVILDGGTAFEEARYFSIVPENNHGLNTASIWTTSGQLAAADGRTSPSRTLVDRNGNVWAALRAPGIQAGVTRIFNVDDNISACHPRCKGTRGPLAVGATYTEGTPIPTAAGSTLTLLPSTAPVGAIATPYVVVAGTVGTQQTHTLRPGTPEAATYACNETSVGGALHSSTDLTDLTNYDDCVAFTISLGAPAPDPDADSAKRTANSDFGRAAAIAPNCDPITKECDVWIGMYSETSPHHPGFAHLSFNGTNSALASSGGTAAPYDVQSFIDFGTGGVHPYGITVDCAGIAWTTNSGGGQLEAVSTVAVTFIPDGGLLDGGYSVAPETIVTRFPTCATGLSNGVIPNNSGYCGSYGISSDQRERIWIAGYGGAYPASACSFNGQNVLNAQLLASDGGPLCASTANVLKTGWAAYDFGNVPTTSLTGAGSNTINNSPGSWTPPISRGINVDKYGNVFMGVSTNGVAAVSFNPDVHDGGSTNTVNCYGPSPVYPYTVTQGGGNCGQAAAQLNWATNSNDGTAAHTKLYGYQTIGIDLDANGNAWVNNQGGPTGCSSAKGNCGSAVQLNGATGQLMNHVSVGNGPYSYSDFTGYALRYLTLLRTAYNTIVHGCGVSPELTEWTQLSYTGFVPPGTDLQFDVRVVNSNDPTTIAAAHDFTVCDSVNHPTNCHILVGGGSDGIIDLTPYSLPQGAYLEVSVTMSPLICAINGGANPLAKPVIYSMGATQICTGN